MNHANPELAQGAAGCLLAAVLTSLPVRAADNGPWILAREGQAVVLIKPQFEAGRSAEGRGGLVKDPRAHLRVLEEVLEQCRLQGLPAAGLMPSPIRGGDGNIEYLAWLRPGAEAVFDLPGLVRRAWQTNGKEVRPE